jgi:hypothetical protein
MQYLDRFPNNLVAEEKSLWMPVCLGTVLCSEFPYDHWPFGRNTGN